MYLTDLTFLEDGNSDKRGELVNYKKCALMADTLRKVKQYQLSGYDNLAPDVKLLSTFARTASHAPPPPPSPILLSACRAAPSTQRQ